MNSVRRAIFMLSVLLLSLTLPNAVAWRADGWLIQEVVGGERLAGLHAAGAGASSGGQHPQTSTA